ncbi:NAD(P)-binding domain-containing protein [Micromonospora sp. NPDC049645]|uniref:NAD(P)-dependent oxidoreductase n=1 Tax=Micromonospora sp. NPDC049645 TaxID=3155508 RepID=UPI003433F104
MVDIEESADRVAVIGTGAIGGAVVRRLRAAGRDVTVWNRRSSRTAEMVELGAVPAASLGEATSASALILLTVTDHAAVRQCLDSVGEDLSGRTVVAMCTGTPGDARSTATRVAGLGGQYLDAGLQASPDMIGAGAATILYSGSPTAFEQHRATLGLVGAARFVGETPDAAAVWDLALFGVWYDAQLGLLRALDVVREAGIDVVEFSDTATSQLGHVVAGVPATVSELRGATYPPGPANLVEHHTVLRQILELRAGLRLGDGGLPEVVARIEALIAAGRHGEGLTATIG